MPGGVQLAAGAGGLSAPLVLPSRTSRGSGKCGESRLRGKAARCRGACRLGKWRTGSGLGRREDAGAEGWEGITGGVNRMVITEPEPLRAGGGRRRPGLRGSGPGAIAGNRSGGRGAGLPAAQGEGFRCARSSETWPPRPARSPGHPGACSRLN